MVLKPSDIIAGGALVLTGLANMKAKTKWIPWVLIAVGIGVIGAAFWPSADETRTVVGRAQSAKTTGPNSPIYQAQGNQVIGISESMMRELLRDKSIAANRELIEKYPDGYVLLGLVNGKLIYEPRFKDFTLTADWDRTTITFNAKRTEATLTIYKPGCSFSRGYMTPGDDGSEIIVRVPLIENEPTSIPVELCTKALFLEVLDASKKIFVIGIRPA